MTIPRACLRYLLVLSLLGGAFCHAIHAQPVQTNNPAPPLSGRVLVLGDSITYAGFWVEYLETALRLNGGSQPEFEIVNIGLPSETVSGLSEPGHADGKFPRPDLHERLERALTKTSPKVVIACYGMNDGIYYPFSEERFKKFQEGTRRMHDRVVQAGARIIHLTPPVFDPEPIRERTLPAGREEYKEPFVGYNQVLDIYSEWLVSQQENGWEVVDIHAPINRFMQARREKDPAFTLAKDGVHPGTQGHWLIARPLLVHLRSNQFASFEDAESAFSGYTQGAELLKKLGERQRVLKDAWLTEVGHQRPGMAQGLALDAAQARAATLGQEIAELLVALPEPVIQRDTQGQVSITCPATNVVIRYSLDGSEPRRESGPYLGAFPFPWRGKVQARAFATNGLVSGPVTWSAYDALPGIATTRPHSAILPITQNRDWRVYDWAERHTAVIRTVHEQQPKLVFIGDSITHFFGGEPRGSIRNGADVWEKYYWNRNAVNLGFGWDRTENVLWRLQNGELEGTSPKAVVLLIGTNNLDVNSPEEIADGVRAICQELHTRLPEANILLLGLLPRSAQPDARRARVKEVNQQLAKLDGTGNVVFVDIGAKFVSASGEISKEVMADALHPTEIGYEIVASAIEPLVAAMLAEGPHKPPPFPGKISTWNGYPRFDFQIAGKDVSVIVPREPLPGNPWAWKAEFLDAFPAVEIALLSKGFHVVYFSVPDMFGSPNAVKLWDDCYGELTRKHKLARKVALIGLSRGGLYCYNWAAANPEKVACIYGDAPVCDFKSWPAGRGKGKGSPRDWQLLQERYFFKSELEALAYDKNPVDNLKSLAEAHVPLLHVYGEADDVVPWEENTKRLADRYRQLGGTITLIGKPDVGHHPHGLPDPAPIVEFIVKNASSKP